MTASKGLTTYRDAVDRDAKASSDSRGWATYADGEPYRVGDVLELGTVSYARRLRVHEHETGCPDGTPLERGRKSACRCRSPWRLVVTPHDGGPGIVVDPRTVVPVEPGRLEEQLDEPLEVAPLELLAQLRDGLDLVRLPCGHKRTITTTLRKLADHAIAAPLVCYRCADRSRSATV